MTYNPWKAVEETEKAFCEYLGCKYAVLVDSMTNGLFLVLKAFNLRGHNVIFPLETYISPPMMALATNNIVKFKDYEWKGAYKIDIIGRSELHLYDSAKRLRKNAFIETTGYSDLKIYDKEQTFITIHSFHMKKHITSINGKGGLICTNSQWLYDLCLKMRWEGRNPYTNYKDEDQDIDVIGYNFNPTPEQAVFLYRQLQTCPDYMEDLDEPGGYPKLTNYTIFKHCEVIPS